jgi:hypothetical protein
VPWWNALLASRIIPSQLRPSSLCVWVTTPCGSNNQLYAEEKEKKKENSLRYFSSCAYIIYLSVHRRAHSLRAWSKRPGNLTAWAAWRVQGTDFGLSKTPSPCIFFSSVHLSAIYSRKEEKEKYRRKATSFLFFFFSYRRLLWLYWFPFSLCKVISSGVCQFLTRSEWNDPILIETAHTHVSLFVRDRQQQTNNF